MRRLGDAVLEALPPHVARPAYDRAGVRTGIVHFGPGGFHRAHQDAYVDSLLEQDPRWGIAAVALCSAGTIEALERQNGLYTLAILDEAPAFRVIGAHTRYVGPGNREAVAGLLADPEVRLVTATVTEKGYAFAADGTLDFAHPDIVHDLAHPNHPHSLVGWLALGLRLRREAGLAPFATLSCDNMVANGPKLAAAVRAFAKRIDPDFARWIAGEARFPATMVDSITPAADDALRERVRETTGCDDGIPTAREAYADWIVEDAMPFGGPDLASVGAVGTADVGAFERAKLRLLNGAHSSLAWLGLLRGHATVADAMADPELAAFAAALMTEDVIPTLKGRADFDLEGYRNRILERFRNPAIHHRLSQIAWDSSQKLPYRLLDAIDDARAAGRPLDRLAIPIAAWIAFVRRQARTGTPLVDPLADRLAAIARQADDDAALIDGLLALSEIFPAPLAQDPVFRGALGLAMEKLTERAFA